MQLTAAWLLPRSSHRILILTSAECNKHCTQHQVYHAGRVPVLTNVDDARAHVRKIEQVLPAGAGRSTYLQGDPSGGGAPLGGASKAASRRLVEMQPAAAAAGAGA